MNFTLFIKSNRGACWQKMWWGNWIGLKGDWIKWYKGGIKKYCIKTQVVKMDLVYGWVIRGERKELNMRDQRSWWYNVIRDVKSSKYIVIIAVQLLYLTNYYKIFPSFYLFIYFHLELFVQFKQFIFLVKFNLPSFHYINIICQIPSM